jgi:hypothetical protein
MLVYLEEMKYDFFAIAMFFVGYGRVWLYRQCFHPLGAGQSEGPGRQS